MTARILALLLLGVGIFSGCGDAARRLKLVILTDLTGPDATTGSGIRKAAALALEADREALENDGWGVDLTAYDAHGSAQDFSAAVTRIVSQPDVICAVVHTGTAGNLLAVPLLRLAGIPAVFPAETAPLPENDPLAGTLWLSPDDRIHGAADAEWAAAGGFGGVLLLAESGGHSRTVADSFLQRAETLHLTVTPFRVSSGPYSSDWIPSFNSAAPQLVYYSGSAFAIPSFLAELERSGFHGSFLYAEGEVEDRIPSSFESDSIRLLFSPAAYHSEDFFQEDPFAEKYRRAYGADSPPLSELGFDASALCLEPLLSARAENPNRPAAREVILAAWRSGGTWEGLGGVYSLGGPRPCRTWMYSPPHDSITVWMPVPAPNSPAGKNISC
jgi:ABC-type branched-subunit amino acid transport system substrate-binding protein